MRTRARVAATAVIVSALLGACSSSSPSKPAAVARPAPFNVAELEARVVSKAPRGFVRQADDVGDTGPSDLAKAVRDEGAKNGDVLRSEEFVRGYQRLWVGPGHAQIVVFVYQFGSSAGARRNYARSIKGSDTKPPAGVFKFAVPFLPAAQAIGVAGTDKDGSAAAIDFSSGVFTVQIVCNGPTLAGLQARALAIAKDQLRRL
ncbi:MAG TPA: hypothetical protein VL769_07540 [Acidimicrobiia bacterium]|nr:hypothetical protein [Acidimicrobiia bacterium]